MPEVTAQLLFNGLPTIDGRKLVSDLAMRWPDLPAPANLQKGANDVGFSLGEGVVVLGSVFEPIDTSDFEELRVSDRLWLDARAGLASHQSHLHISVTLENRRALDLMALATQVTASAIAASESPIGVYWPATPQVVAADNFKRRAAVLPTAPLDLWVTINVGKGRDGSTTGTTSGLRSIGLREIEAFDVPESQDELSSRLHRLVSQILIQRRNVAEGATLGYGPAHAIRVVVAPSPLGRGDETTQLVYEPATDRSVLDATPAPADRRGGNPRRQADVAPGAQSPAYQS